MKKARLFTAFSALCLMLLIPVQTIHAAGFVQDAAGIRYQNDDGSFLTDNWVQVGESIYHLDANGFVQTGWIQVGDLWYLMDATGVCTNPAGTATPPTDSVTSAPVQDEALPANVVLQYAGKGDFVLSGISLPQGNAYKLTFTHDGKRNFIVKFYNDATGRDDLLANEIGPYTGTALLEDGDKAARTGSLEIKADGNWTIVISTVTNTSTRSLSGSGDKVSGTFKLTSRNTTVSLTNTGKSNFIVIAYFSNGKKQLLANEIGPYTGQVILRNPKGTTCYIGVQSNGQWSIDLGYGDDVSPVPDIS